MPRVCVACGLNVNSDGNLVVTTSGVAGDAAPITSICTVSDGTHIYCDPVTGKLYGEPEKSFRMRRYGMNLIPDDAIDPTVYAPTDGSLVYLGSPISLPFTNPSQCYPMNLLMESGISHCRLDHLSGGGDYTITLGTHASITGSASLAGADTGHQIWRHKSTDTNDGAAFDSMGARAYSDPIIIPPGGTVTLWLQGWMKLYHADGACTIQNYTIDLVYTAWHD